ncbi:TraB/GumN family protein [Flavobacterium cerinum]|uniref:TraB/GumN family protein n=1 Tax=Flavobacterium cerinum TaxID=2502784 RepID=A0A444GN04_9FLAO|nr:TraB/GumN family protein [Flavobacterium cerinum]RWW92121.1 TraB/GumN family protein [Flavobacterium cerinum]
MRKTFIAAISLCCAFASAQKLDNAVLWKISGNGLKKPSYLMGTVHISCDATLDKNILKALDETKQLYLEYDMDSPTLSEEMSAQAFMKDGKKMSQLISPEDFKTVRDYVKKNFDLNLTTVEEYKPFMLTTMFYSKIIDCPVQSYERELITVTKSQKEEVYGLETVKEQMQVFEDIPYEVQMQEIVRTTNGGFEKDIAEYKSMLDAYDHKDLNKLVEITKETQNILFIKYRGILITNRNKMWISRIDKIAKETPTFFGVGALHLVGKEGVIKLLRKKGYKVEPVK